MIQKDVKIVAPSGKLGVLIPGMGAVSTTFMAGVEAVKKGRYRLKKKYNQLSE